MYNDVLFNIEKLTCFMKGKVTNDYIISGEFQFNALE